MPQSRREHQRLWLCSDCLLIGHETPRGAAITERTALADAALDPVALAAGSSCVRLKCGSGAAFRLWAPRERVDALIDAFNDASARDADVQRAAGQRQRAGASSRSVARSMSSTIS